MNALNKFVNRVYHHSDYNCSHFVAEVWLFLTGEELPFLNKPMTLTNRLFKKPLKKRCDPCIVMFRSSGCTAHAGVYTQGGVLHLTEQGVRHQTVDYIAMSYDSVRYYA